MKMQHKGLNKKDSGLEQNHFLDTEDEVVAFCILFNFCLTISETRWLVGISLMGVTFSFYWLCQCGLNRLESVIMKLKLIIFVSENKANKNPQSVSTPWSFSGLLLSKKEMSEVTHKLKLKAVFLTMKESALRKKHSQR